MQYERAVFQRYLTENEEKILFRYVDQFDDVLAKRDGAWMRFLRSTGVRIGTLAKLTCGDARSMLSAQQLIVDPGKAKGKRGYKTQHMNKAAIASLQALLKLRKQMGHTESVESPLVMSRQGRALSIRSFQHRMKHWVDSAGLQVAATPHWFRHTLAKRLLARSTAKDPQAVVQHVLGHSDVNSTAIYTQPDREQIIADLDAA